jgi:Rieske Fe-S protein
MTDAYRRKILNWILNSSLGALAAAVIYPVARFVSPPEIPEADTNLVEAGFSNDPELVDKGFKILRFGNEPVILVRTEDEQYRAFAATCTHLDCIVEFQKPENRIWCNCHNGGYDVHGKVVSGPPPHALEAFKVDLVDNGPGQPSAIVVSRA